MSDKILDFKEHSDKNKQLDLGHEIAGACIIIASFSGGLITYRIVKKSFDITCGILGVKQTGARAIAFTVGYCAFSRLVYHLNDLRRVIKEVKDGRG